MAVTCSKKYIFVMVSLSTAFFFRLIPVWKMLVCCLIQINAKFIYLNLINNNQTSGQLLDYINSCLCNKCIIPASVKHISSLIALSWSRCTWISRTFSEEIIRNKQVNSEKPQVSFKTCTIHYRIFKKTHAIRITTVPVQCLKVKG